MTPTALKSVRLALGMTQPELAKAIGMSTVSIARMEAGRQPIEARTAMAIELLSKRSPQVADDAEVKA